MAEATGKQEAVRLARERLGDTTSAEAMAAYVAEHFGITLTPVIVKVLLGSLLEREVLEQSGRRALAEIEKARGKQPAEEKKPKVRTRKKEAEPQPGGKAEGEMVGM